MYAIRSKYYCVAKHLILKSIEYPLRDLDGVLGLFESTWSNDEETVRLFIGQNADSTVRTNTDRTILHFATLDNDIHLQVVTETQSTEFDVSAKDTGVTALDATENRI